MGKIRTIPPVRPLAGILAPDEEWLARVRTRLEAEWGALAAVSVPGPFLQTEYYTPEMGAGLWRQFLVFQQLRPAEDLPDWKHATNAMEAELGNTPGGGRRVNIDPGYLAPGKLVLASTKDHEQRIYLRNGIYAEITLRVRAGKFSCWDWTYPDYAQASLFFDQAYQAYLQAMKHPAA
jgi:hypothetical protein